MIGRARDRKNSPRHAAAPTAVLSIRSARPSICSSGVPSIIRRIMPAKRRHSHVSVTCQTMIPLSILDLSPVSAGSTAAQALRNSLDLARLADELGYRRYWVAEHHNLPAIASSAPDIMIGQIAAITKNMRIGSGGVMLPNHAPLMVAERFKVLEALYPGRIDLGLGRAPGTDPATSYAL